MDRPFSAGGLPAAGDVIVRKDPADGGTGWTLSIVPGPPQVHYPTLDVARQKACEWAGQNRVAVWTTDDGERYTRVEVQSSRPVMTRGSHEASGSRDGGRT
jgi:hypothetical protein